MLRKTIDITKEYKEYLKSDNSEPLNTAIENTLESDGFELSEICVRFVREENLSTILESGTDRNGYGVSFDPFSTKEDSKIMERYGLKPRDFTYVIDQSLHDMLPEIYGAQIRRVQSGAGELPQEKRPSYILMLVYNRNLMKPLTLGVEPTNPSYRYNLVSREEYGRCGGPSLTSVLFPKKENLLFTLDAKSFTANPLDVLKAIYSLRLS